MTKPKHQQLQEWHLEDKATVDSIAKGLAEFRRERKQLVALDWDTDIAPLIKNEDVSYSFWQGPSMQRLIDSMKHTLEFAPNILGRPHRLLDARHIVFELSLHPDYELPMPHLAMLSDFLTQLPNKPEIAWGLSRDPKQQMPLALNILYTTK